MLTIAITLGILIALGAFVFWAGDSQGPGHDDRGRFERN
jgi:hypothetical protein